MSAKRGICSSCLREGSLTARGGMRMHLRGLGVPAYKQETCPGTGQPPAELVADPVEEAEQRGREAAAVALIEALRDGPTYVGWRKWLRDNNIEPRPTIVTMSDREAAASFLEWFVAEAKKETT